MKRRKRLAVNQVWVTRSPRTRTPSRWVIAITETEGKVCYSAGGNRTCWCKRITFRAWIREYDARATRPSRKRSLTLQTRTAR